MRRVLIIAGITASIALRETIRGSAPDVVLVDEVAAAHKPKKSYDFSTPPLPRYYHESFRKGKGEKKRLASARQRKGWG